MQLERNLISYRKYCILSLDFNLLPTAGEYMEAEEDEYENHPAIFMS